MPESSSPESRYRSSTRTVGILNLFFAVVGLAALAFNSIGLHGLPDSFISEYGAFVPKPFHAMAVASLALLLPLGAAGFLLLRRISGAVICCEIVFVTEIVYFVFFWYRWSLGISPLHWSVVLAGLLNLGLFLQIISAYPLIGLIRLEVVRRALMHDLRVA
jgi:hypothetical protein